MLRCQRHEACPNLVKDACRVRIDVAGILEHQLRLRTLSGDFLLSGYLVIWPTTETG